MSARGGGVIWNLSPSLVHWFHLRYFTCLHSLGPAWGGEALATNRNYNKCTHSSSFRWKDRWGWTESNYSIRYWLFLLPDETISCIPTLHRPRLSICRALHCDELVVYFDIALFYPVTLSYCVMCYVLVLCCDVQCRGVQYSATHYQTIFILTVEGTNMVYSQCNISDFCFVWIHFHLT